MPREPPLCRFFAQGTCTAPACSFRHELPASSSVCLFYLAGNCAYGKACRYDHVRPKAAQPKQAPPPRPPPPHVVAAAAPPPPQQPRGWSTRAPLASQLAQLAVSDDKTSEPALDAAASPSTPPSLPPSAAADPWDALPPSAGDDTVLEASRAARAKESADAASASSSVECGICLEPVLSKPTAAERRFGLLSGCGHVFCLSCLRGWRGGAEPSASATAHARACPLCRNVSYYVVPSVVWPADGDAKAAVVDAYRARLARIPCRNFDAGRGSCPFGTSCWYAHRLPDGSVADAGRARTVVGASEEADDAVAPRVVAPVRLGEFLAAH